MQGLSLQTSQTSHRSIITSGLRSPLNGNFNFQESTLYQPESGAPSKQYTVNQSDLYSRHSRGNSAMSSVSNSSYLPNSVNWQKKSASIKKYKHISNMGLVVKKKNLKKITRKIGSD